MGFKIGNIYLITHVVVRKCSPPFCNEGKRDMKHANMQNAYVQKKKKKKKHMIPIE
jgi:hypothetical protein